MNIVKKIAIIPLIVLMACSSDSSAPVDPSNPENPGNGGADNGGTDNGGSGEGGTAAVSLPSTANIAIPEAQYPIWKQRWVVSMAAEKAGGSTLDYSRFDAYPNAMRVKWDTKDDRCDVTGLQTLNGETVTPAMRMQIGCTVSEGVGYGMLLTVFNDDRTTFDGLWAYNRGARTFSVINLMPWQLLSFNKTISNVAALDADLDIATALILAYHKWGDAAYLEDAKTLVTAIYDRGINKNNNLTYPGNNWTQRDVYNLSYFSPVAFRLFASIDDTHPWNDILNSHYEYMLKIQQNGATKAIFPDWTNGNGEPKDPENGSAAGSYMLYDKESVRIPWRIAWDYYWYQDDRAKEVLTNLANFIVGKTGGDPAQIPEYSFNYLTGELSSSKISGVHYKGAYCLSGLGVNPDWVNNCTSYFNTFEMSTTAGFNGTYFMQILQMMYSSLLNGKFVKPF